MSTEIATRESKALSPLADTMNLGQLLAQSGYFQDARDMAQAVVKVLAGRELGFGPIASMTGIYIVKGRVTLSANLMAAAVKRSGRYNYRITEHTDQRCTVEFYEDGKAVGTSSFSVDDAKRAGLSGDNWRGYPRNMLFARALSNGAKWYCADIWGGPIYTPDELGAEVDGETGEVVQPAKLAAQPIPQASVVVVPEAPAADNGQDTGAPKASYEPFGAVTMVTKMAGGSFHGAMLEGYFGEGIKTKSRLEGLKAVDEAAFRAGYDRLHAEYLAWKDQQPAAGAA